jgi:hypothetical protein
MMNKSVKFAAVSEHDSQLSESASGLSNAIPVVQEDTNGGPNHND